MVCLTRPAHTSRTNSRRIIKIGSKVAHDMSNIAAMLLHPGGGIPWWPNPAATPLVNFWARSGSQSGCRNQIAFFDIVQALYTQNFTSGNNEPWFYSPSRRKTLCRRYMRSTECPSSIVDKFAGWIILNLDFKVMIFFNVKYRKWYKIDTMEGLSSELTHTIQSNFTWSQVTWQNIQGGAFLGQPNFL